jgi:spoIIIJ-associated protein
MSAVNRIEVQAKTVEEAIRLGLAQLNRQRDEVQIDVLREPTGGIFGFGAEEAVVRLSVLPAALAAADDEEDEYDEDEEYEDEEYEDEEEEPADEAVAVDDATLRELEEAARETLEQVLLKMGIDGARVTVRERRLLYLAEDDPPTTALDVSGQNLGVLIGRKGETLAALQYIVNLPVNKRVGQWTRVLVDVGGYRRRREESLEGLAQRVAYRVAQSHRAVTLEPMPPNERRVIHMVLRDNSDVYTESSGEGESRKVTILPRPRGR